MPDRQTPPSRYLAEWYTPRLHGVSLADLAASLKQSLAAMPDQRGRPELLYAIEVPQDAYAFGVFVADSVDLVVTACRRAGLAADRVTPAIEVAVCGDAAAADHGSAATTLPDPD
jgi:hypothetical protein